MTPLELIRTIKTNQSNLKTSQIISQIYQKNGLFGFYSGFYYTLLRDTPYSVIYWLSYEKLRVNIMNLIGFDNYSLSNFIAGGVSGFNAALLTHPFDVLKSQKQLFLLQNQSNNYNHTNILTVNEINLYNLIKINGILSIFRGFSMRLATVIPSGAIMITIYEIIKNL